MDGSERLRLALSWSGGKDSALALWTLRDQRLNPEVLVTTVTGDSDRVSMHGTRRDLLLRQAAAASVPLVEVEIPVVCTNEEYEDRMERALRSESLRDVEAVAFGDLFLEDIRRYRETRLAAGGRRAVFPLWHRDTSHLAREFIAAGFEAILACVDPTKLDRSFVGRTFDQQLLDDLPANVDPCGENGEFHTFVYAGPIFAGTIALELGSVIERDGFTFADLSGAG
jgi:uncharacterized protein (TIGR00290 family)